MEDSMAVLGFCLHSPSKFSFLVFLASFLNGKAGNTVSMTAHDLQHTITAPLFLSILFILRFPALSYKGQGFPIGSSIRGGTQSAKGSDRVGRATGVVLSLFHS